MKVVNNSNIVMLFVTRINKQLKRLKIRTFL